MSSIFYKGFSSHNWDSGKKSFSTVNKEIVKRDLLNHIFTVKGERVMMPNFGTRIPNLAFEPLDQNTVNIIREDITEVIKYDPRVELKAIDIYKLSDNNAIIALVQINYIELNEVDTLNIEVPYSS